jgi:hypothetical protein
MKLGRYLSYDWRTLEALFFDPLVSFEVYYTHIQIRRFGLGCGIRQLSHGERGYELGMVLNETWLFALGLGWI